MTVDLHAVGDQRSTVPVIVVYADAA